MNRLVLWVAQGLGLGLIPVAPGTFGTALGLAWFAVLLLLGNALLFGAGCVFGVLASAWCCGRAEHLLQQKDPGSVVLDEIVAVPICFAFWLSWLIAKEGKWPGPAAFFTGRAWIGTLLVFLLFRVFDILKPWPVRQSQALQGGWGVTIDDVLAAVYVNLVSALALLSSSWFHGAGSPLPPG